MDIPRLANDLTNYFNRVPSCAVAYSGGVDSVVVAKAAFLALGDKSIALTAVSESLASGEFETAERVARSIGIAHQRVYTDEMSNPEYLANQPDRCWHCKTTLYDRLRSYCDAAGIEAIANGMIVDDLGDYRPGIQAAKESGVLSPLAELGVDKAAVRRLAAHWELEVWDKPATPCLSSRVAYGLAITPELLNRVDAAESFLKSLGLTTLRVRCHPNDLARLEIPVDEIPRFLEAPMRELVIEHLQSLGFAFVTLDLQGFRSGSFNHLVQLDVTERQPVG